MGLINDHPHHNTRKLPRQHISSKFINYFFIGFHARARNSFGLLWVVLGCVSIVLRLRFDWLRRLDLNQRSPGHEPGVLDLTALRRHIKDSAWYALLRGVPSSLNPAVTDAHTTAAWIPLIERRCIWKLITVNVLCQIYCNNVMLLSSNTNHQACIIRTSWLV